MNEPRRFRLIFEDDGSEVEYHCAAFGSEAAREQALAGAAVPEISQSPAPVADEVRQPGRPSFDDLIDAAVAPIEAQLEQLPSLAARARLVLRRIAQDTDAADIPSRDTVERFLRDRPPRQKARQNCRQKSPRSKMISGG